MKSLSFLFLFIGTILFTIGYNKTNIIREKKKSIIEYRFLPESLYSEQLSDKSLTNKFKNMFEGENIKV